MCKSTQIPTSECVYDCSLIEEFEKKNPLAVRMEYEGIPSRLETFLDVDQVGYLWFGCKREFRWMMPILTGFDWRFDFSDLDEDELERFQEIEAIYNFVAANGDKRAPLFYDIG